MYIKDWKKEILSIPNLLSLFRLALIPVYIVIYLNATEAYEYFIAGTILAVSCLTDMIDGKVARHFNMITNLGKLLDPVADKLTQFALTVCLSLKYPPLRPVLALFVVKESFQLIALLVNLRKGKALKGALISGKICTTVLFISLTALVLFPLMPPVAVQIIAATDTVFLLFAFICYILAYFGKNKHDKVQNFKADHDNDL